MRQPLVQGLSLPESDYAVILGVMGDEGRQIVEAFFRRARADRKKWTHLAAKSGVGRSTIQRWEDGETSPEFGNFVSVVRAAGYTLGEIEEDARQRRLAIKGIGRKVRRLTSVAERELEPED